VETAVRWQPSSTGTVKAWFDERARWRKRNKKAYPPDYDADRALERFWGGPAARAIVDAVPDDPVHEAHRFLDEVDRRFTWPQLQDSEQYTKQVVLREALERVVEQQIGRVDRVGSHWNMQLERAIDGGTAASHCPFIEVRAVIFDGTYDAENWRVLLERWDELRAQLHGIPVPTRLAGDDLEARAIIADLCEHAPDFTPRASCG
jgi:hypothetical protein